MKVVLNIEDDKADEFIKTVDEIIQQNKDINVKVWALGVDLKKEFLKVQKLKRND